MKKSDLKEGLVVITTNLSERDPNCLKRYVDARRPCAVGILCRPADYYSGAWLVNHNRGNDIAAYMPTEIEPFVVGDGIEVEAHASSSFMSNECSICGKRPTLLTVSFWLCFRLGTHILVYFCEEHMNHVDILKGVSKALAEKAGGIEKGPTWQNIVEEEKKRQQMELGVIAIRAVDYDQAGCPHCSYQRPDVTFVPNTISYRFCEKCNQLYVVFADGIEKKSVIVELPSGKVRATLRPLNIEQIYNTPWKRTFKCTECNKEYPSDRRETKCDDCDSLVKEFAAPYRNERGVTKKDGCT